MRISDPEFRNRRRHEQKAKLDGDDRSPSQRDRDRLLYSSALRRLAEVTQVVAADSGYVFHNRLTHSLQVAQVGRRLAEKLLKRLPEITGDVKFEGLDPDVVESACLAHDLGHPPFGHIAEEELNALAEEHGGFEGNAQSFRILARLAFRSADYRGLDLTRATLAAVLKYPWFKGENSEKLDKFGAYESERKDFEFARELYPNSQSQAMEAALMDWADDITYSIHDLEDFYRAGRMPLHLLGNRDPSERQYFFADVFERRHSQNTQVIHRRRDLEEAFTDILVSTFPPIRAYGGSETQRIGLRNFTGTLIGRYINGVDLVEKDGRLHARVKPEYKDEVFMLKELTWTYVIQAPSLATQQWGLKQKVRELFRVYTEASASLKEWKIFPIYYQERLSEATGDDTELVRVCVDLIASMTENQVHKIFGRLTGSSSGSSLEDPLQ
jgi:dGTPase